MSLNVIERKKVVIYGKGEIPIIELIEPGLGNGAPATKNEDFRDWYSQNSIFKDCPYSGGCSTIMDSFNLELRYCLKCPIYKGGSDLAEEDEDFLAQIHMIDMATIEKMAEKGKLRFFSRIEDPQILSTLEKEEKPATPKPKKNQAPKPKGEGKGLCLFLLKYSDSTGSTREERHKIKKLQACELAEEKAQELGVEVELWVVKKNQEAQKVDWEGYLKSKKPASKRPCSPETKPENPQDSLSQAKGRKKTESRASGPEFIKIRVGEVIGEVDFIFSPRDIKNIIQLSQENPRAKGLRLIVDLTWKELENFNGEISSLP